jgi:hypothetical protein
VIAAGGMGEVYRGRLVETGDPVAIKMIKPEFAGDEAILALFRKEASALYSLSHDAIVRYFIFSVDKRLSRPYLAMEYVDGPSLNRPHQAVAARLRPAQHPAPARRVRPAGGARQGNHPPRHLVGQHHPARRQHRDRQDHRLRIARTQDLRHAT